MRCWYVSGYFIFILPYKYRIIKVINLCVNTGNILTLYSRNFGTYSTTTSSSIIKFNIISNLISTTRRNNLEVVYISFCCTFYKRNLIDNFIWFNNKVIISIWIRYFIWISVSDYITFFKVKITLINWIVILIRIWSEIITNKIWKSICWGYCSWLWWIQNENQWYWL